MKIIRLTMAAALILGLGACTQDRGNKEIGGTLVGAAAGGLLGSQIGSGSGQLAATAAGVFIGGLIGSEVGRSLDKADQAYAAQTYQTTMETNKTGQTSTWVNPDSGHSGQYTPTKTYQTDTGNYCREFQQTITVGGKTETAYGTACRQPDGSWKIVQ